MSSNRKKLTVGLFQMPVGPVMASNVEQAVATITNAKLLNPKLQLAILPESVNAPYGIENFTKYAEQVPGGYTCQNMSNLAKTLSIHIVAGSIVERVSPDKLYNTCTVWGPTGKLITRYRKIHLLNVDIDVENEGGVRFDEDDALSPGNEPVVVEIEGRKIGIGIGHDMRFDELARLYRNQGCDMIVYPSAFCIGQGPMHWELLQRSRANDNQLFVVSCSPARNNMSGYVAHGHSMIVDPWGRVQREAGTSREVIVDDIDFDLVGSVRRQIPIFTQRRTDIYSTEAIKQ